MIDKEQAKTKGLRIIDTSLNRNNVKQELLEKIKHLVPSVINSDDQLDINALKDFLGLEHSISNNKGYELTFAGKGLARAEADSPAKYELRAEQQQSKDFQNTQNAIICGDNLEVLKILYGNYHNRIKMIYIDPPYNTKSDEFIYEDILSKTTKL